MAIGKNKRLSKGKKGKGKKMCAAAARASRLSSRPACAPARHAPR